MGLIFYDRFLDATYVTWLFEGLSGELLILLFVFQEVQYSRLPLCVTWNSSPSFLENLNEIHPLKSILRPFSVRSREFTFAIAKLKPGLACTRARTEYLLKVDEQNFLVDHIPQTILRCKTNNTQIGR